MKRSGMAAALYLLLTFVTGTAVGSFGFWLYTTRSVKADTRKATSEDFRRRYLNEMETRLKLVPDQVQKLVAILDTTRNTFRELNDKHRPEYEAIQSHQREQINGLLNDVQRSEYQKMLKEREERRKQRPFSPPSGY